MGATGEQLAPGAVPQQPVLAPGIVPTLQGQQQLSLNSVVAAMKVEINWDDVKGVVCSGSGCRWFYESGPVTSSAGHFRCPVKCHRHRR